MSLVKRTVTWAALAVVALGGALGAIAACGSSPVPSTRDQRWRYDIAYVARELPLLRAGGLGNVSPAAWNAAAGKLEAQVPRLTDGQLTVGLAQLVAMLHDDETQVEFGAPQFYPVVARWFGSGLYLVVVPRADRAALGSRLLAVDGKPGSATPGRFPGGLNPGRSGQYRSGATETLQELTAVPSPMGPNDPGQPPRLSARVFLACIALAGRRRVRGAGTWGIPPS